MNDAVIWAILILSTLSGGLAIANMQANAEAGAAAKRVLRERGVVGVGLYGCLLPTLAFGMVGCWVAYAIAISDWRFAAIPLVPFTLNLIAKAAAREARKP